MKAKSSSQSRLFTMSPVRRHLSFWNFSGTKEELFSVPQIPPYLGAGGKRSPEPKISSRLRVMRALLPAPRREGMNIYQNCDPVKQEPPQRSRANVNRRQVAGSASCSAITHIEKLLDLVTSGAREPESHSWRGWGPAKVSGTCHLCLVEDRLVVWTSHRIHKSHP